MSSTIEDDDAGPVPAPPKRAPGAQPRVSRAQAERRATQRPGIGSQYQGRLHIDPKLLDTANFEFTWIREESMGERDAGNIHSALNDQGYEPVDASKYPHLKGRSLPGHESKDTLIRRGGQILMARPRYLAEEVRAEQVAETEFQKASVMRNLQDSRAASDPKYVQPLHGEGVSVTVDRGDTGTGKTERFQDA